MSYKLSNVLLNIERFKHDNPGFVVNPNYQGSNEWNILNSVLDYIFKIPSWSILDQFEYKPADKRMILSGLKALRTPHYDNGTPVWTKFVDELLEDNLEATKYYSKSVSQRAIQIANQQQSYNSTDDEENIHDFWSQGVINEEENNYVIDYLSKEDGFEILITIDNNYNIIDCNDYSRLSNILKKDAIEAIKFYRDDEEAYTHRYKTLYKPIYDLYKSLYKDNNHIWGQGGEGTNDERVKSELLDYLKIVFRNNLDKDIYYWDHQGWISRNKPKGLIKVNSIDDIPEIKLPHEFYENYEGYETLGYVLFAFEGYSFKVYEFNIGKDNGGYYEVTPWDNSEFTYNPEEDEFTEVVGYSDERMNLNDSDDWGIANDLKAILNEDFEKEFKITNFEITSQELHDSGEYIEGYFNFTCDDDYTSGAFVYWKNDTATEIDELDFDYLDEYEKGGEFHNELINFVEDNVDTDLFDNQGDEETIQEFFENLPEEDEDSKPSNDSIIERFETASKFPNIKIEFYYPYDETISEFNIDNKKLAEAFNFLFNTEDFDGAGDDFSYLSENIINFNERKDEMTPTDFGDMLNNLAINIPGSDLENNEEMLYMNIPNSYTRFRISVSAMSHQWLEEFFVKD